MSPEPASKEAAVNALEQELVVLLRRIRRVVAERAHEVHEDLQVAAYFILARLASAGSQRSSELVEEFGVDKGAISRQVHQLVELGLVAKQPDPVDGRAQVLVITADGRRRLDHSSQRRRRRLDERLAGWSDAELGEFVDALARYNRTFETD